MRLKASRKFAAQLGLTVLIAATQTSLLIAQNAITAKDVVPILEKNCFQCHGESLKMSDLDLRTREAMLKGGKTGPRVVPGNAAGSLLYKRIAGLQPPLMPMPPVQALTPQEIALIQDWINQGAKWPTAPTAAAPGSASTPTGGYKEKPITDQDRQWWAFQKPVRHPAPAVNDARWRRNPIDAFMRKAMDDKGLQPAPEADRRTLIRS